LDTRPTFGVFFITKYSEQLKLKLVKQYLAGVAGTEVLAERHGVSRTVLRRWVAAYEQHGREGLRKKFNHYDAQYQLKVLQAGDRHSDLKSEIKAVYERHKGGYGYRRITAAIRQAGHAINHKTVQRLMG
jgi:transposase